MARSTCLVVFALLLAGCGGRRGASGDRSWSEESVGEGRPIKVSYLRFDTDMDNKKLVPSYRVMLSRGWSEKYGEKLREPMARLYRSPYLALKIPDDVMDDLVRDLEREGLGSLKETPTELINLQRLQRIEKTQDRAEGVRTRILTVDVGGRTRTVTYADNDDSAGRGQPGPLLRAFLAVERALITSPPFAGTIQVRVENQPVGR